MARAATTTDAFNAVAEPRRRQILDLLATGERPVSDLVELLGLAQPQVSKHLRVLREVGLVTVRGSGQQRLYTLNADRLRAIYDWVRTFEPLWDRRQVESVQITAAEELGMAGGRGGYYDKAGALRDMVQNHLLQLLALTAMEEPVSFEAEAVRAEKAKILSAVRLPADLGTYTVRGQYSAGWQGGEQAVGYLEEDGIDPKSKTDTYAAVKLEIDNRRWAGVPFYLRTGKRLGRRVTEIAVVFQRAPHSPFDHTATEELGQNALVIRVQPDEGVTMRFGSKVPGTSMEVRDVSMDFAYGESFTESSPEAYERLILDVLLGDSNLFPRLEEVEQSWRILDPIEAFWDTHGKPAQYESGTWGPVEADEMLAREGRSWRRP